MPPPNYDSRVPNILACAIASIAVSTFAVILRFWSRAVMASLVLWWDDWAILVTLIFSHAFLATNIWWTTVGLGKHSWMLSLDTIKPNAIANRVALVLYATTIMLIKISALLLYRRLFQVERKFNIALWSVGAVCVAWWIVTAIYPWSNCHPISKTVNPLEPGTCVQLTPWYLGSAFINAFLDLVVLVLPIPVIWRLKMSIRRRLLIMSIFVLGYCSAFLSFARFIIIVRDPDMLNASTPNADPSWDLVPLLYLSMLEAPFAIIALCGPSINQLVARVMQYKTLSSLFTTRPVDSSKGSGSGLSSRKRAHTSSSGFSKLDASKEHSHIVTSPVHGSLSTTAIAGNFDEGVDDWREQDIPMGTINVSHDISVARRKNEMV
ncbi:integral membrane protein [Rutstroemia sp. NJR-2017a BVV2]|nr:integral membrane protein [Rutstroemia sp. NJR-2017a BVV2]